MDLCTQKTSASTEQCQNSQPQLSSMMTEFKVLRQTPSGSFIIRAPFLQEYMRSLAPEDKRERESPQTSTKKKVNEDGTTKEKPTQIPVPQMCASTTTQNPDMLRQFVSFDVNTGTGGGGAESSRSRPNNLRPMTLPPPTCQKPRSKPSETVRSTVDGGKGKVTGATSSLIEDDTIVLPTGNTMIPKRYMTNAYIAEMEAYRDRFAPKTKPKVTPRARRIRSKNVQHSSNSRRKSASVSSAKKKSTAAGAKDKASTGQVKVNQGPVNTKLKNQQATESESQQQSRLNIPREPNPLDFETVAVARTLVGSTTSLNPFDAIRTSPTVTLFPNMHPQPQPPAAVRISRHVKLEGAKEDVRVRPDMYSLNQKTSTSSQPVLLDREPAKPLTSSKIMKIPMIFKQSQKASCQSSIKKVDLTSSTTQQFKSCVNFDFDGASTTPAVPKQRYEPAPVVSRSKGQKQHQQHFNNKKQDHSRPKNSFSLKSISKSGGLKQNLKSNSKSKSSSSVLGNRISFYDYIKGDRKARLQEKRVQRENRQLHQPQNQEEPKPEPKHEFSPNLPPPRFDYPTQQEFNTNLSDITRNVDPEFLQYAGMELAAYRTALAARQSLLDELRQRVSKAHHVFNHKYRGAWTKDTLTADEWENIGEAHRKFLRWLKKFTIEGIHDIRTFEEKYLFGKDKKVHCFYHGMMEDDEGNEMVGVFIPLDLTRFRKTPKVPAAAMQMQESSVLMLNAATTTDGLLLKSEREVLKEEIKVPLQVPKVDVATSLEDLTWKRSKETMTMTFEQYPTKSDKDSSTCHTSLKVQVKMEPVQKGVGGDLAQAQQLEIPQQRPSALHLTSGIKSEYMTTTSVSVPSSSRLKTCAANFCTLPTVEALLPTYVEPAALGTKEDQTMNDLVTEELYRGSFRCQDSRLSMEIEQDPLLAAANYNVECAGAGATSLFVQNVISSMAFEPECWDQYQSNQSGMLKAKQVPPETIEPTPTKEFEPATAQEIKTEEVAITPQQSNQPETTVLDLNVRESISRLQLIVKQLSNESLDIVKSMRCSKSSAEEQSEGESTRFEVSSSESGESIFNDNIKMYEQQLAQHCDRMRTVMSNTPPAIPMPVVKTVPIAELSEYLRDNEIEAGELSQSDPNNNDDHSKTDFLVPRNWIPAAAASIRTAAVVVTREARPQSATTEPQPELSPPQANEMEALAEAAKPPASSVVPTPAPKQRSRIPKPMSRSRSRSVTPPTPSLCPPPRPRPVPTKQRKQSQSRPSRSPANAKTIPGSAPVTANPPSSKPQMSKRAPTPPPPKQKFSTPPQSPRSRISYMPKNLASANPARIQGQHGANTGNIFPREKPSVGAFTTEYREAYKRTLQPPPPPPKP